MQQMLVLGVGDESARRRAGSRRDRGEIGS